MLIESANTKDTLRALFLPQNVSIEMFGNGIHRNGDLLYVDSRSALGSYAGPILGIGGYYRVVRCSHNISKTGFQTNLECVFELRAVPFSKTRSETGIGANQLMQLLDEVE